MINSQPPPVYVQQKRGMGCFGIGCVIVLVVVALVAVAAGAFWYFVTSKVGSYTSTSSAVTQTFDGGNEMYQAAQDKISAFQQAQQQGKPASLELSSDEVNTLIARNPDLAKSQIHAFVTMSGNRMHLSASLPTSFIPFGVPKDRFFNGEAEFTPAIDPVAKTVNLKLYRLRLGEQEVPADQLSALEPQGNMLINQQIQRSPDAQNFISRIETLEVRDGKLEIQTK